MSMTRLTILCTLLLSPVANAETVAEILISGCQELVEIYNQRGEKNLFASIATSEAEAFRAGYCRGTLEQYQHEHNCRRSWHAQALHISEQPDNKSTQQLLRDSCK